MQLSDAIIYHDIQTVIDVLRSGAKVNEIDRYGYTPLTEAALANKTDIAKLLLNHGAKADQPDLTGNTPLHWAIENNNMALAKILLQQNADPNNYNLANQPSLVMPILRDQLPLKNLLYQHDADLNFALDFINGKVLGHRFEVRNKINIVNSDGHYLTINLEGFFLESTIRIIGESLKQFQRNYGARHLRHYTYYIQKAIDGLTIAAELTKYQQFNTNIHANVDLIDRLLDFPLLIMPIAHHGHAITLIKLGNWLARCDRGEASLYRDSVIVSTVGKPSLLDKEFMKALIYKKQPPGFIEQQLGDYLGLTPVTQLGLPSQTVGNCSWANVEACIPTIIFMVQLFHQPDAEIGDIIRFKSNALTVYEEWREWDKDRALDELINSFAEAQPARQAAKVELLAAILFQSIDANNHRDIKRARKIFPLLCLNEYEYVLKSYLDTYGRLPNHKRSKNLNDLMNICQIQFPKPLYG